MMRRSGVGISSRVATIAIASLAVAAPVDALQAIPGARATLDVDATEVTVGDRLNATLMVEHRADQTVMWPDSLDLSPFEVLAFSPSPPRIDGDRAVSTASIVLAVFELGELDIPPVELGLSDASGGVGVVRSDPFAIGVVSVGLDEGQDIRDVKGPRAIARDWLLLWPWLLLVGAVSGLAYWLARRRLARGPAPAPVPVVSPAAPHEVAYAALDRLAASTMLERGEVKAFHIEVSQILRTYFEDRFGVDALEMTTREVLVELETAGIDPAVRGDSHTFLRACDLVKFAKRRPDEAESRALIQVARGVVDATVPIELPEEVETPLSEDEEAA